MIDKSSETWRFVSGWANGQIDDYKVALEVPGTDLVLTEQHRVAISVLRQVLALAEPNKPIKIPQKDTGYGLGTGNYG